MSRLSQRHGEPGGRRMNCMWLAKRSAEVHSSPRSGLSLPSCEAALACRRKGDQHARGSSRGHERLLAASKGVAAGIEDDAINSLFALSLNKTMSASREPPMSRARRVVSFRVRVSRARNGKRSEKNSLLDHLISTHQRGLATNCGEAGKPQGVGRDGAVLPLISGRGGVDSLTSVTLAQFGGPGMRVARAAGVIASSILAVQLGLAPAEAEKRVALVIGNGDYQKVGRLANPTNDAKAISGLLQSAGFDEVVVRENLGIREMRRSIDDFADIARDADSAVVYFSGHGMEVNGVNYLVPVDAVLDRDTDVPYETVSLDTLVQVLEPARRLRLVMLDACRDNPFVRTMKRTVGSRAVGRGLAPVEPTSVNTLIAYAAKAGSIALDGDYGSNSPYATAVLNSLAIPGLDLRLAFGRVRDEVLKVTHNRQEPFVYGSLGGSNVSIVDSSGPAVTAVSPPAANFSIDRAAQAWGVIQNTTSVAVIEDFIRQFDSTPYASMARARLTELKKTQVAVAAPSPAAGETKGSSISVAGRWHVAVVCPAFQAKGSFEFNQTGDRFTGSSSGDGTTRRVYNGMVSGSTISFMIDSWESQQKWIGTVSGSRLSGSFEGFVGIRCSWTASR